MKCNFSCNGTILSYRFPCFHIRFATWNVDQSVRRATFWTALTPFFGAVKMLQFCFLQVTIKITFFFFRVTLITCPVAIQTFVFRTETPNVFTRNIIQYILLESLM